ncbi:MAG: ferrous iron transport protein B [Lachnospiraceae bacterium]|nr:ferrous iron transport protein B [Lachnospiraceae bacterium]
MELKIALAGNPNCGKTTLFNELTGSSQYVGNWPGVTVEKKEGKLKGHKDVIIQDLPGIYSLSPYSMEEVVSRNYLVNDKPDVILNIIDGSNIERNLYLTTQLLEIGIPTVVAVNMMDVVEKNGDKIDVDRLEKELKCKVVTMSAIKGDKVFEAAEACIEKAKEKVEECPHVFTGSVEHALAHIEESIQNDVDKKNIRWFAIKIFERDKDAYKDVKISPADLEHMEQHIKDCEKEMDDDAESIITNQRYEYIQKLVDKAVVKKKGKDELTTSDKIDKVLTNRILALPIFAVIMFLVYYIAMGPLGTFLTDWTNDVLFGEIIPPAVEGFLTSIGTADWVQSLVLDGIIAGVGTVLGFVPQIAILFVLLSILEDSGYMARVAFIFDRIFRRFGLSGKSFIPMVVGTGCGVPAIMATRTIEEEKDRRMTILLATFIPCAAKMEIVLLMTNAFFGGNALIATSMYFIGIAIVIVFGIILKKMKYFSGDPAPFVMELPAYHLPSIKGLFIHVWERVKGFMIKAGTIIFTVCVILWFLMSFNFRFELVELEDSILKAIGDFIAPIFAPLGFGNWQGAVATVSAELAKEQATATLGMLAKAASEEEEDIIIAIQNLFGAAENPIKAMWTGLSFMLFNIFNAPCLVAIVTAFKEQGEAKWGWFTFIFQMLVGYFIAMCTYNIGMFATQGVFTVVTALSFIIVAAVLIMLFMPTRKNNKIS